jgi:DnaJ-class molecular chaperone
MASIDIHHDYYGDLELPSSASMEDIKKSFRKLGLAPQTSKQHELTAYKRNSITLTETLDVSKTSCRNSRLCREHTRS